MFILQKVCDFVDKVEISLFDRGGVGPSKKRLILVQRSQHKSTSDLDGAPKNSQFEAIFIKFGDAKKCYTFSGLELVPKSSKKLIGGLTCMHKFHKSFKPFGTIRKKIAFVENYKECAICAILRKNHFGHTQRLKKVLRELRCAKNAPQRPPKNANPSGLSEKNVYSVESLRFGR